MNSPFAYINFNLVSSLLDTAVPTTIYLQGNGTNVSFDNTFTCNSACAELQTANTGYITNSDVSTSASVPEPATFGLLGLGLAGLAGLVGRKIRTRK